MSNISPPTQRLIDALTAHNIPFELTERDGETFVSQTPAVVEFLTAREALHDPDAAPVVRTKEELLAKEVPQEPEAPAVDPNKDPMATWLSFPSRVRSFLRAQLGVPRLTQKREFQTAKQGRRGTPGAFGGPSAALKRAALRNFERAHYFNLLVLTAGGVADKAVVARATTLAKAKGAALLKYRAEFPQQTILDIVEHNPETQEVAA